MDRLLDLSASATRSELVWRRSLTTKCPQSCQAAICLAAETIFSPWIATSLQPSAAVTYSPFDASRGRLSPMGTLESFTHFHLTVGEGISSLSRLRIQSGQSARIRVWNVQGMHSCRSGDCLIPRLQYRDHSSRGRVSIIAVAPEKA